MYRRKRSYNLFEFSVEGCFVGYSDDWYNILTREAFWNTYVVLFHMCVVYHTCFGR